MFDKLEVMTNDLNADCEENQTKDVIFTTHAFAFC